MVIKMSDLEIISYYHPAQEFGGDFYNNIKINNDKRIVFIGDVVGNGNNVYYIMNKLLDFLNYLLTFVTDPSEILTLANKYMLKQDNISTLLVLMLDIKNSSIILANAGHMYPIIINQNDNKVQDLEVFENINNSSGLPLGIIEYEYENINLPYDKNNVIVLYTDGIIESKYNEQIYGKNNLMSLLNKNIKNINNIMFDINQIKYDNNEYKKDKTLLLLKSYL